MARSRTVEAPARNDVYFGMWLVALLATVAAVMFLCLELTEYGWDSKPATASAPSLPNVPVATVKAAGGTTMAEPQLDIKPAPIVEAAKSKPTEPAPSLTLPPAPIPPTVISKKPEVKVDPVPVQSPPAPVPSGPIPGFVLPKR